MELKTYIEEQRVPKWVKDILRDNLTSVPEHADEREPDSNLVKCNVYFNWKGESKCIKLVDMIDEYDLSVLYTNFADPIILLTYMSENVMFDPHCGCLGRKLGDFERFEMKENLEYFSNMFKYIYNMDIQTYEEVLEKRDLYHLSNTALFDLLKPHIEIDPIIIIKILTIQNAVEYLCFSSGKEEDSE
jgi:hypothetical protein